MPACRSSLLLHTPLARWASRTPEALAARAGQQTMTYARLRAAARSLACRMLDLGLRPGDRVGLLLGKSLDALVAVYAILEAGGAYVPLDEQSPPSRQLEMLADAELRGLVAEPAWLRRLVDTDAALVGQLGFVVGRQVAGTVGCAVDWDFEDHATSGELPPVDPEQPAYILYTSGSTGRPKGVVVSHQGAAAFVSWAVRSFEFGPGDRIANQAQLSFDLSVLDLFGAVRAGAEVVLIGPELMLRPRVLRELLDQVGVTTWYSVPSALMVLVEEKEFALRPPTRLSRVLFAGEVFPMPRLRRAMQVLPQARFHNLFGPTETNVCLWHPLQGVPDAAATAIPIGKPCDHLRVELLDETGQPCHTDQPGEISVAGPTVLLGYWRQPEATARAFWPDNTVPGVRRLYRTGDRAYRDDQGNFWFLGRRDRLVKRRGYRIELGEIEAALGQLPGVREVVAVARPDEEAGVKIQAFLVAEPGVDLDPLALRLHSGSLLPRYMLPDSIEMRPELPRTATGKVDFMRLR